MVRLAALIFALFISGVAVAQEQCQNLPETSYAALRLCVQSLVAELDQLKRAPGPQGEKGEKGDKGDKGDPGAAGRNVSMARMRRRRVVPSPSST
jgi:hypothetical protein